MIEKPKEGKADPELLKAAQSAAPNNQDDAKPENDSKNKDQPAFRKPPSKGEKLYTWGVYSGMNYWLNLGSSIVIADYFCNLGGKDILKKGATKIANAIAHSSTSHHEKIFHNSQTALKTLTLLSGGWLLIVPTKLLEDNKRPVVHWLNKQMGIDQTGADGKELTSDQIYIECEQPKTSWLNVIGRRTLATGLVMGSGQVLNAALRDREKTNLYKGSDDPHGGKAVVEKFVVENVNHMAKSLPGGQAFIDSPRAQRYLGLLALDAVFTKITAFTMKKTNGAQHAKMPGEIGDDQAPAATAKGLDQIDFVSPAEEKKPDHAARVRTERSDISPESFRKKPVEKADNYASRADKPIAAPSMGSI